MRQPSTCGEGFSHHNCDWPSVPHLPVNHTVRVAAQDHDRSEAARCYHIRALEMAIRLLGQLHGLALVW